MSTVVLISHNVPDKKLEKERKTKLDKALQQAKLDAEEVKHEIIETAKKEAAAAAEKKRIEELKKDQNQALEDLKANNIARILLIKEYSNELIQAEILNIEEQTNRAIAAEQ